jgi:hypothetical protein
MKVLSIGGVLVVLLEGSRAAASCSNGVPAGAVVNVATLQACPGGTGAAATGMPTTGINPVKAWLFESGIDYLTNGVHVDGINTWSRITHAFRVPSMPTRPDAVPVRLGGGLVDERGGGAMGVMLLWGENPEFGIIDRASWYVTVVFEEGNPLAVPPVFQAIYLSPLTAVKPGDWIDGSIQLSAQAPNGMYGVQNLWTLSYTRNGGPAQSFQVLDAATEVFEFSFLASIATDDTTINSCYRLPPLGQMAWISRAFYWDENLHPGDPTHYTEDIVGPFIPWGSPYGIPTSIVPADCPAWPKVVFSPPNFALGWSSDPIAPPSPPPVPAAGSITLIALAAGLGVFAFWRLRLTKRG